MCDKILVALFAFAFAPSKRNSSAKAKFCDFYLFVDIYFDNMIYQRYTLSGEYMYGFITCAY